jgi:hypothetical protein
VPVLIAALFWLREFVGERPKRQAIAAYRKRIEADYAGTGLSVKAPLFASAGIHATGTLSGIPVEAYLAPKTRESEGMASVTMHSGLGGDFMISRESDTDQYFKRIGFAIELQTGDAEFDAAFYISGASQALFADAKNRDALRKLFDLGVNRVTLYAGKLTATSVNRHEFLVLEPQLLTEFVRLLASLRMPPGAMGIATPATGISTPRIGQICLGIAVAGAALFATAWFATEPLVNGWWPAVWRVLPVAIAAMAVLLGVAVALLRGRSAAHRELLIVVTLALPAILLGGWGAAVLANQRLDRSEVQEHKTRLVDRYSIHTRGQGTNYYLVFESWRPGGGTVKIEATERQFEQAARSKRWIIRTHQGWFGFEWVL